MRVVLAVLVFFWACFGAMAQDQDERVGEGLVMVQGTSLTINTGLACDQRTYQMPTHLEADYLSLWPAIDNGDYQNAFDLMRRLPSRTDVAEYDRGMVNDFREYLAIQPGLPQGTQNYFQGKAEDCVGDPNQYLSPAWCLQQYGIPFINQEFGVGTPGSTTTVKRYPRWETTGGQGLDITFLPGKIVISALAWDPTWIWQPHPDYGDISKSEVVSYVPFEGAKPTLRFGVTVVGTVSVCKDGTSLSRVSGGYAVPLLTGRGTLVVPTLEPVASLYKGVSNIPSHISKSIRRDAPSVPVPTKAPQYLRVPISPGYPPSYEGEQVTTQNPPDGGLVLSSAYPKMIRRGVIAIPENMRVEITDRSSKWFSNSSGGGSVQVAAPIRNVPVKAEIDSEVGYSAQLLYNGQMGYSVSGPVAYDERKWLYYRTTYHWEAVNMGGKLVWKLRNFQLHQRIGLERIYNHHEWNGYTNNRVVPFVGTITGWRSKGWVWIGWTVWHPFTKGHWEYRSVQWPWINDGYQMIVWAGTGPENPDGMIDLEVMEPPTPIYRGE